MKRLFGIAMIACMLVHFAGTAHADDRHVHGRAPQRVHRHPIHRRYAPGYVQEDPVYAPPLVVEPPSGINIILPLNIH